MRLFDKRFTRALQMALAVLLVLSARSSASQLTVYPDSVHFTTEVGVSTNYTVYVSDGRDSSQLPHTPLTDANVWITGSSDYRLGSDSIISFFGESRIVVDYEASSLTPSSAILHIQGDSNTVEVYMTGNPPDHQNLTFNGVQNFGILTAGVTKCDSETLYNPNGFSVTVTSLKVQSQNVDCQLTNTPSLPFTLGAYQRVNFDACLVGKSSLGPDTNELSATIQADYTYPNGSDVAYYTIGCEELPLDSTCLSVSSLYLGDCNIGTTSHVVNSITNRTSSDVTVDSIVLVNGDISEFALTSSEFPMTIHADAQSYFHVAFTPPSSADQGQTYSAGILIYAIGTSEAGTPCEALGATVSGTATIPIVDSVILDAPPGGASTITFTTSLAKSRYLIFIKNDTSVSINPEMLQITDSGSDAYFNTPGTKSVNIYDSAIAPGATTYDSPIIMTLDVPDTGTYNIDMALTYQVLRAEGKMEITSSPVYNYHLVAHRVPAIVAGVSQSQTAPAPFTLYPNPAHGDVTVTVPTGVNSTIEIYDILGNLLLSTQSNGPFIWNGETSAGTVVPNGTYIVRVRQAIAGTEMTTSSKQLMFLR